MIRNKYILLLNILHRFVVWNLYLRYRCRRQILIFLNNYSNLCRPLHDPVHWSLLPLTLNVFLDKTLETTTPTGQSVRESSCQASRKFPPQLPCTGLVTVHQCLQGRGTTQCTQQPSSRRMSLPHASSETNFCAASTAAKATYEVSWIFYLHVCMQHLEIFLPSMKEYGSQKKMVDGNIHLLFRALIKLDNKYVVHTLV